MQAGRHERPAAADFRRRHRRRHFGPDMQDHVFGEFNQVEENKNRSHDGTGLGLARSRNDWCG
jgi:hypothetical protein